MRTQLLVRLKELSRVPARLGTKTAADSPEWRIGAMAAALHDHDWTHSSRCRAARNMKILLYRSNLSVTSGAGQLIQMQAEGLRAAGEQARIACRRGRLKFFLRTRLPVKRASMNELRRIVDSADRLLVDHGMEVPEADLVFVHNLMAEAVRHLERADWSERAAQEAAFFRALRPDAPIVANSELVRRALGERLSVSPERVVVHYPGFDAARFRSVLDAAGVRENSGEDDRGCGVAARHRRQRARAALGVPEGVPLVGFVTSGDFRKRGLDIFLETAALIAKARPDVRFLVVGSKRLPEWAARHGLVTGGRVLHRPKSSRPERWFAALDVFLYPAYFEEFGMVVSEAQASGVPVLTSRRVGAAECLPRVYDPWLIDEPESGAFAAKALALLDDDAARAALAAAGVASVARFDREHYVRATVELIRQCAREKAQRTPVA